MLSLIASYDRNRVIGAGNRMPWHLPADLAFFRQRTLNKTVVMGSNTWSSLPAKVRPLPHRTNWVLTSRALALPDNVVRISSVEAIVEQAKEEEIVVAGGGKLYDELIDRADRLYLTHVDTHVDGDCWFPAWTEENYQRVYRKRMEADSRHAYPFTFAIYDRRPEPSQ